MSNIVSTSKEMLEINTRNREDVHSDMHIVSRYPPILYKWTN